MGPKAGLDRCGKSDPHRDSIPGLPTPYPVAIPTELPVPRDVYRRVNLYQTTWRHIPEDFNIHRYRYDNLT